MSLLNVADLPQTTRMAAADRIRVLKDFALPELDYFNSKPCPAHESLDDGLQQIPPCRACGIRFRKHQKVGIAWLYMRGRGLIADQCGSGKTPQAAGLLAVLKQAGELDQRRAMVVVRPSVLGQWMAELARFLPGLAITAATGTRKDRVDRYLSGWEVLVVGFQVFCRDADLIDNFTVGTLIIDDIDPLRNPANQTAYALKRLARRCDRVAVFTGTPLQKRLTELHSVLEPVGGLEIFGSATRFRREFVREDLVKIYNPSAGRMVTTRQFVGYQNLDIFIARAAPLTLRRTPDDIDDVDLPTVSPHNVFLDLHPAQKARYEELRKGVLRIIRAEGTHVKAATAMAKFLYGAQICAGLVTLGEADGPGTSVKLDWVQNMLTDGDLSEEKVVVFCQFTHTVAALKARLAAGGVGHVVIWGRDQDPAARARAKARFWDEPGCRVLIGTAAIEQGLNLQVARHLICVDQLINAARMTQLAGRIRRDGSAYRTVYVHNLLARATQEEGYLEVLAREQGLSDFVWGETSELYEALNPLALLQLIGGSGRRTREPHPTPVPS